MTKAEFERGKQFIYLGYCTSYGSSIKVSSMRTFSTIEKAVQWLAHPKSKRIIRAMHIDNSKGSPTHIPISVIREIDSSFKK